MKSILTRMSAGRQTEIIGSDSPAAPITPWPAAPRQLKSNDPVALKWLLHTGQPESDCVNYRENGKLATELSGRI